jgi:hypothetical protein
MQLISLEEVSNSSNPIWFKAITTKGISLIFAIYPYPAINYDGYWYRLNFNENITALDGTIFGIDSDNYFIMEESSDSQV